jgi:hypothetical protein
MNFLKVAVVALVINLAGSQCVLAAEWVFCIAPAKQERRIYITDPFFTNTSGASIEVGFRDFLNRGGLRHDTVQCPVVETEESIRAMRQYA